MVNEVSVKIRLEVDEGDKQKIRNQAQAIKDTGSAPIQNTESSEFRGGLFGDTEDPTVKGFEKRQSIGGGVDRLRDRTSSAPVDLKSVFEQSQEQTKLNEDAIKEQEKRIDTQEDTLSQLITNPRGFFQDKLKTSFRDLPFITPLIASAGIITALIASPQMVQGLINLLKDNRIIGVFKRDVLNERNPFLSRQQQRARLVGEQSVIFSNTSGFVTSNGNLTTNTLSQIRANGISDIGLRDKSGGLF